MRYYSVFLISLGLILISSSCMSDQTGKNTTSTNKKDTKYSDTTQPNYSDTTPIINTSTVASTIQPSASAIIENKLSTQGSGLSIEDGVWIKRDLPPSDVMEQVKFVDSGGAGGGDSLCETVRENETQPTVIFYPYNEELTEGERKIPINRWTKICAYGFTDGEIVEVTILKPDKTSIKSTIPSKASEHSIFPYVEYEFVPKPGDPLGEYELLLRGKTKDQKEIFEVVPAEYPTAGVYGYNEYSGEQYHIAYASTTGNEDPATEVSIDPGMPVEIYLAGFPPNSILDFYLFKGIYWEEMAWSQTIVEYATTWTAISDDRGELIIEILTNTNTPQNVYLLLISSPNKSPCSFHIIYFSNLGINWGSTPCDIAIQIIIGNANLPIKTISVEESSACPGAPSPRLHIGDYAYVSYKPPDPNTVRKKPGKGKPGLGFIQPGEQIEILEGPVCADHWVWWKVRSLETGLTGWTAEGDRSNYWLISIP